MGVMAAITLGLGVASGLGQMAAGQAAGKAANRDAQYNASIKSQQAGMIADQQSLLAAQDARKLRFAMGKHTATTAGKGLEMTGSPMAIAIDTATQMNMDASIGQYNLEIDKRMALMEAESLKRGGRMAERRMTREGAVKGLTTMFSAVASSSIFAPKGASIGAGSIKATKTSFIKSTYKARLA